MKQAIDAVTLVTQELESQSLNAVVAGFSFAAALAWMDLVRFLINQIVKVQRNGGMHYTLTALFTTLLSVTVYLIMSQMSSRVRKPLQPVYAVTRA
jgi:uncharacterized membrane protein required for colicin V production